MKKIATIINECALEAIRDLLMAQAHDIPVSEVRNEHSEVRSLCYRGVAHHGCEKRVKIETLVPDSDAMLVVHAILSVSRRLDSNHVAVSHLETVQSMAITKLEGEPNSATPAIVKRAGVPFPKPSQYACAI